MNKNKKYRTLVRMRSAKLKYNWNRSPTFSFEEIDDFMGVFFPKSASQCSATIIIQKKKEKKGISIYNY